MEELESLKAYNNIYLEIIMKYRDAIEEKEGLYIADLPRLVTPEDESVILLSNEIKSNFPSYSYDENFSEAARIAYDYVRQRINTVSIPIQFWLKPAETIRHSAENIFDKAVLLCSVMLALGGASSKVVVIVKNSERHFIVYAEYLDRTMIIDIEDGIRYGSFEAMMKEMDLGSDNEATAYEFNDKMYRDIV